MRGNTSSRRFDSVFNKAATSKRTQRRRTSSDKPQAHEGRAIDDSTITTEKTTCPMALRTQTKMLCVNRAHSKRPVKTQAILSQPLEKARKNKRD